MRRILCVVSSMDVGGAETFLMKIYRSLDITKYQMDFCVATNKPGFYDSEIIQRGGQIFRITAKTQNIFLYIKDLKKVFKSNKYVAVLRNSASCFGALDLWIAKCCGVKKCILRSSNAGIDSGKISRVLHLIFRIPLTSVADIKIAPSRLAGTYTFGSKAVNNGKVVFLHNAVDTTLYTFNSQHRDALRNQLGVGDKLVVGHIGRFNIQKNHKYLIEIFKQIKERNSNSVLLLIGKGELEQFIHDQVKNYGIEKDVLFLGIRSDIPEILMAMDVLVFPSLFEGMPNVVIEAQATGLPCVISDKITDEANITGLVKYLSIDDDPIEWALQAIDSIQSTRVNMETVYRNKNYSIDCIANEFIKAVYQ